MFLSFGNSFIAERTVAIKKFSKRIIITSSSLRDSPVVGKGALP